MKFYNSDKFNELNRTDTWYISYARNDYIAGRERWLKFIKDISSSFKIIKDAGDKSSGI